MRAVSLLLWQCSISIWFGQAFVAPLNRWTKKKKIDNSIALCFVARVRQKSHQKNLLPFRYLNPICQCPFWRIFHAQNQIQTGQKIKQMESQKILNKIFNVLSFILSSYIFNSVHCNTVQTKCPFTRRSIILLKEIISALDCIYSD